MTVVSNLMGSIAIAYGCVSASKVLHHNIVDRLLHAPMSFFDTTPLGRIMNRVSRDIDAIDFNIPLQLRMWFYQLVPLVATIIIISYGTPYFLLVAIPVTGIFLFLQVGYPCNFIVICLENSHERGEITQSFRIFGNPV